ncbi:MAG: DUF2189 domain-containing protein [Chromatiales bacterium]|jgi:uncharacterized membrane protein
MVDDQSEFEGKPFVAPCNKLDAFAGFRWLKAGWSDFRRAPRVSLIYGGFLVALGYLLAFFAWQIGGYILLFSVLSGLVFIAPVFAFGLYSVSCQIQEGYEPRLGYCLREGRRHFSNELIYSFILLVVFLLWARAGSAIHIFFPMQDKPSVTDLLAFFGVGSAVGAVFATVAFCASAFSLPMMLDRRVDAVTAVITSVNAVLRNKLAMFIWAGIIVVTVLLGLVTALLGFAVLMPVIGYATWHGYRQTIIADEWTENVKLSDGHQTVEG